MKTSAIKKLRGYIYWIRIFFPRKIKRLIVILINKIGLFSLFYRLIGSKIQHDNFKDFIEYKNNFDKFICSTIMLEKIIVTDKKYVADILYESARKQNSADAQKALDEYFSQS